MVVLQNVCFSAVVCIAFVLNYHFDEWVRV